ncbi:MAG: AAA family ATPase [Kiritimatiellae bacterium]|nr:AAA family ATPase [Kiritimatiellia bacterium]
MSTYRGRSTHFAQAQVLRFMRNAIANHVGEVAEENFFLPIASLMSATETAALIRGAFPPRKIQMLEKIRSRRCRLDWDDENEEILRAVWNAVSCRRRLAQRLIQRIDSKRARCECLASGRDRLKLRLDELQRTLGLSDLERDIALLSFLVANAEMHTYFRDYGREKSLNRRVIFLAECLDRSVSDVARAVESQERLRRYGLLDADLGFNKDYDGFLYEVEKAPLATRFYRRVAEKPLPWSYYGALAERQGDVLKALLASRNSARGMNILFYGAPGTGKTSFARSLAAELGLACYEVVQDINRKGDAALGDPRNRFAALQICASQVDGAHSLLVIDEADDMLRGCDGSDGLSELFGGRTQASGDKGLLNSVLDGVQVPCVWIANVGPESLAPSSRRRFDYSIRFGKLDASQRAAIWRNSVSKFKLNRLIPPSLIETLSGKYETSAGGIAMVLRNLADLKPKAADCAALIGKLLEPHCALLGIQTGSAKGVSRDYSLAGLKIHGDMSPDRIVEAVQAFQDHKGDDPDRPRMNLLLSGPPGSGKTEFVKHLGEVLKTKVIVKTGSNLLSMWVGGTEKNIANAFTEAENDRAILFFDEVDGLMQARERAQRSWEVTQVNELLQRMESFAGVFIAATNFLQNLDPASIRRFTFKLAFDYLDRDGKMEFFHKMFKTELTPEETNELDAIAHLVPGDFRTVRQGLFYLGVMATNADRLAALRQESDMKRQGGVSSFASPIGFHP